MQVRTETKQGAEAENMSREGALKRQLKSPRTRGERIQSSESVKESLVLSVEQRRGCSDTQTRLHAGSRRAEERRGGSDTQAAFTCKK
jgi:hypothetical protein